MRRPLTKAARANSGDTVVITCSLAKGEIMQRVSVWSGSPGFDLSPHVDPTGLDMLQDGRPVMRKPTFTTLSDLHPNHEFTIEATEPLLFRAVQDIDVASDKKARASIRVYSPRALRVRNFIKGVLTNMKERFYNGKAVSQK